MDYLILLTIGLVMGVLGGLLGIGGSVIMIPAMTVAFGENQHLYQASAMICNFCVGASSALAHKKARSLYKPVLKSMVPMAMGHRHVQIGLGQHRDQLGHRRHRHRHRHHRYRHHWNRNIGIGHFGIWRGRRRFEDRGRH